MSVSFLPVGYQIKVDSSVWIGSSRKFVKKIVERRKEEYAHADEVTEVSKQCEAMKVNYDSLPMWLIFFCIMYISSCK